MRSFFNTGFRGGFEPRRLGQLDFLAPLIGAGVQAGATIYSSHVQQQIAAMQKRTQEDIQNKQDAAAAAAQAAQAKNVQTQAASDIQQAAVAPKILGIPQNTFIGVGVGLALILGVIAIVVTSGKSAAPAASPSVGRRIR